MIIEITGKKVDAIKVVRLAKRLARASEREISIEKWDLKATRTFPRGFNIFQGQQCVARVI